jgi:hypothetical protein
MSVAKISTMSMSLSFTQNHQTSTSTASQAEQVPTHTSLSHTDRDSAIALGVLLIVISLAAAYYIHKHLKRKREAEIERRLEAEQEDSTSRSIAPIETDVHVGFRTDSLWSKNASTLRCSESTQGEKAGRNAMSISSPTSRSQSSTTTIVEEPTLSHSRSPSPHSRTPSTRSHHRRQSSVHSIPVAILADAQRRSLQTRDDKRWWTDVARRGSTTRADRRFSSLPSIPEPEVAPTETCAGNGDVFALTRLNSAVPKKQLPPERLVPGVVPECVSDDDDEECSDNVLSLCDFRGVVWNKAFGEGTSNKNEDIDPAPDEMCGQGVQVLDWATDGYVSDTKRRQTMW